MHAHSSSAAAAAASGETNIRFSRNVHHTYIVQATPPATLATLPSFKPTPESAGGADSVERRAGGEAAQLNAACDFRQRFLRSVVRKPLYLNRNFNSDPWRLIGRIADETVLAAVQAVQAEIGDLGEAEMVRAFIRNETTTAAAV